MAAEIAPFGRITQRPPAVKDIHIVWITAGLGCDGDSVSITAATQPSVEDVVLGAIPGLPKVHLHNPVLAYEVGDDFMKYFYQAEQGLIDPFVLVVEGSIPNENISGEGYWAAMGTDAMCSAELGIEHSHLIEPARRRIVCACQACSILFSGSSDQRYRRIPQRIKFLQDFSLTEAQWDGLLIPIGML